MFLQLCLTIKKEIHSHLLWRDCMRTYFGVITLDLLDRLQIDASQLNIDGLLQIKDGKTGIF